MRTITTSRARIVGPAFLAVLLTLGACSSGGDDATDDVATLGASTDEGDDSGDDDGGGGGQGGQGLEPEFQDAVLEFAECMRDHGVDMPDPEFTEDGGVMISAGAVASTDGDGGGQVPSDADMAEMDEANEACEPIMEEARGSMPEPDPEQMAEMQDQALEFAECMREHGIDFPDPTFDDEGGRMSIAIGGPGEGDAGTIDPSDEDFQAASEECGGEGGFGFTGPAMRVDDGDEDDG
jgi:hypothetical protein